MKSVLRPDQLSSEYVSKCLLIYFSDSLMSTIMEYVFLYNSLHFMEYEETVSVFDKSFIFEKAPCYYFIKCIFNQVDLTDRGLIGRLFQDSEFKNTNLSNGDLSRCSLNNTVWILSNLSETKFIGAKSDIAAPVMFFKSNLERANFSGAILPNAEFINCLCRWANFNSSNLTNVKFDGSVLVGADFSNANLKNTILSEFSRPFLNLLKESFTTFEFLERLLTHYLERIALFFNKVHTVEVKKVLADLKKVGRGMGDGLSSLSPYLSRLSHSIIGQTSLEKKLFPLGGYIKFAAICTGLKWPLESKLSTHLTQFQ